MVSFTYDDAQLWRDFTHLCAGICFTRKIEILEIDNVCFILTRGLQRRARFHRVRLILLGPFSPFKK
jgi:hypothetical protein